MWNLSTGEQLFLLNCPYQVTGVAISPDDSLILTITGGDIVIWNSANGTRLRTFLGHWGYPNPDSITFSAGGEKVLTASYDAFIWDLNSLCKEKTFPGCRAGRFSSDGERIALNMGTKIQVVDGETYELLYELPIDTTVVSAAEFVSDGAQIIAGNENGTVSQWKTDSGELVASYQFEPATVTVLSTEDSASRILTGARTPYGKPNLWDLESGTLITQFPGAYDAALSNDGNMLCFGSGFVDYTARLFNDSGELITEFPGHLGDVTAVDISSDGARVLTGSVDQTIRLWDAQSGEQLKMIVTTGFNSNALSFSPDGSVFAVGGGLFDNAVTVYDSLTGEVLSRLPCIRAVDSLEFSEDGELIAMNGSFTRVWAWRSGVTSRYFWSSAVNYYTASPIDNEDTISFSPDMTRIAEVNDESVYVWELNPPRAIIVAGSSDDEAANAYAVHTASYAYSLLRARDYPADGIRLISSVSDGIDIDGDGLSDVDAEPTEENLASLLTGDFAKGAGRLFVLMVGDGERSGAFRLSPAEIVSSATIDEMLDKLQSAAKTDVTILADYPYSGRLTIDAALTDADDVPVHRRTIIASTSHHGPALQLPPPAVAGFAQSFLASAFMGSSYGEALRASQRFFDAFPVDTQSPMMDRASLDAGTPDSEFFGAVWTYGALPGRDRNAEYPVIAAVTPDMETTATMSIPIYARMMENKIPDSVSAIVRPLDPMYFPGGSITGLPQVILIQNESDPLLWEGSISPDILEYNGVYTVAYLAQTNGIRISSPEFTSITVTGRQLLQRDGWLLE